MFLMTHGAIILIGTACRAWHSVNDTRGGRSDGVRKRPVSLHRLITGVVVQVISAFSVVALIPVSSALASQNSARMSARGSVAHATGPFAVIATTPATGATGVLPSAPIVVKFSEALSPRSPMPSLVPSTPGSWSVHKSEYVFTPRADFIPLSDVKLTIPGGSSGIRSATGGHLARTVTDTLQIANGSILRLQQLLSLTDYSPLRWRQARPRLPINDVVGQRAALYRVLNGEFLWRYSGWPANLQVLWKSGQYNVFTEGMVMSFQADHGLAANGVLSSSLWSSLLNAYQARQINSGGYNYGLANKTSPETLTIWHDGHVVLTSPSNTGISVSPTVDGNFTVYLRYRSQIMKGTNPNGSHYADPVQYVAYFNGNDAVHYMPRAGYGSPQSLGCIELPLTNAAVAWPYLAYGTIVSVIN